MIIFLGCVAVQGQTRRITRTRQSQFEDAAKKRLKLLQQIAIIIPNNINVLAPQQKGARNGPYNQTHS